jgi:hypothetical protein
MTLPFGVREDLFADCLSEGLLSPGMATLADVRRIRNFVVSVYLYGMPTIGEWVGTSHHARRSLAVCTCVRFWEGRAAIEQWHLV